MATGGGTRRFKVRSTRQASTRGRKQHSAKGSGRPCFVTRVLVQHHHSATLLSDRHMLAEVGRPQEVFNANSHAPKFSAGAATFGLESDRCIQLPRQPDERAVHRVCGGGGGNKMATSPRLVTLSGAVRDRARHAERRCALGVARVSSCSQTWGASEAQALCAEWVRTPGTRFRAAWRIASCLLWPRPSSGASRWSCR